MTLPLPEATVQARKRDDPAAQLQELRNSLEAVQANLDAIAMEFPIQPGQLANATTTEDELADGAVTTPKLATAAVTAAKIDTGAVTNTRIGTGAVSNSKLGTGAVTSSKISNGEVTNAKLANNFLQLLGSTERTIAFGLQSENVSVDDEAGSQSFSVTHGLGTTPIMALATSTSSSFYNTWVGSFGATTFTVILRHVDNTPWSGNADFCWIAIG